MSWFLKREVQEGQGKTECVLPDVCQDRWGGAPCGVSEEPAFPGTCGGRRGHLSLGRLRSQAGPPATHTSLQAGASHSAASRLKSLHLSYFCVGFLRCPPGPRAPSSQRNFLDNESYLLSLSHLHPSIAPQCLQGKEPALSGA